MEHQNLQPLIIVIDGLKLQGCDPTFLDARDAILLADDVSGGFDECVIWTAFAKRGMGTGANDFGNGNSLVVVEDFSVPIQCVPEPGQAISVRVSIMALAALRRRQIFSRA